MVAFLGPADFRETVYAFQTSRIILTAYELELFTCLDGQWKSSAECSKQCGAHPRAMDRLMNALVACGLLEKRDSLFRNTGFASQYLVKGKEDYLATYGHTLNMWQTWSRLTDAVREGKPVSRPEKNNEDWTRNFIAAMHDRARHQADRVVELIRPADGIKVLDVGGGSGVYAMAFVRAGENITARVFDLPEVIAETRSYLKTAGLEHRISTISGNYHEDDFGQGYDLVFLSAIVHINSDEENEALIIKCARSLKPGGYVVIQDHLMEEDRTAPLAGAYFALNMLVATQRGDTYTESEMRRWYKNAGLEGIRIIPTQNNALVIGQKPSAP